jgi:hypothetical protein
MTSEDNATDYIMRYKIYFYVYEYTDVCILYVYILNILYAHVYYVSLRGTTTCT